MYIYREKKIGLCLPPPKSINKKSVQEYEDDDIPTRLLVKINFPGPTQSGEYGKCPKIIEGKARRRLRRVAPKTDSRKRVRTTARD
jgi:hypothetical protein